MAVSNEKLREKLTEMPLITQKIRKVKAKDGREWYVVETKITTFFSPQYIKKVIGGQQQEKVEKQESLF